MLSDFVIEPVTNVIAAKSATLKFHVAKPYGEWLYPNQLCVYVGDDWYQLPNSTIIPACTTTVGALVAYPKSRLGCTFALDPSPEFLGKLNEEAGNSTVNAVSFTCTGLLPPRVASLSPEAAAAAGVRMPSISLYSDSDEPEAEAEAATIVEVDPQAPTLTVTLGAGEEWAKMVRSSPKVTFDVTDMYTPASQQNPAWGSGAPTPVATSIAFTLPASAVTNASSCVLTHASALVTAASPTLTLTAGLATLTIAVYTYTPTIGSGQLTPLTVTCAAGTFTLPTTTSGSSPGATYMLSPLLLSVTRVASAAAASLPTLLPTRAADVTLTLATPLLAGRFAPVTVSFVTPLALTTPRSDATSTMRVRLQLPGNFSFSAGLQTPAVCARIPATGSAVDLEMYALTVTDTTVTAELYLDQFIAAWGSVTLRCRGVSYPLAATTAAVTAGVVIDAVTSVDTLALTAGSTAVPIIPARAAGTFGATTGSMTFATTVANSTTTFVINIAPLAPTTGAATISITAPLMARLPSDMRPAVGTECTLTMTPSGGGATTQKALTVAHTTVDDAAVVTFSAATSTTVTAGASGSLSCPLRLPVSAQTALRDVVWTLGSLAPLTVLTPAVTAPTNVVTFSPNYPGATTQTMRAVLSTLTANVGAGYTFLIQMPVSAAGRGVFLLPGSTLHCGTVDATDVETLAATSAEYDLIDTTSIKQIRVTFGSTVDVVSARIACTGLTTGAGLAVGVPQPLVVEIYNSYPPAAAPAATEDNPNPESESLTQRAWIRFEHMGSRPASAVTVSSVLFTSSYTGYAVNMTVRLTAFTFPLTNNHLLSVQLPASITAPGAVTCAYGLVTSASTASPTMYSIPISVESVANLVTSTRVWSFRITSGNLIAADSTRHYVLVCEGFQNPDRTQTLGTATVNFYAVPTGYYQLFSSSQASLAPITAAPLAATLAPTSTLPFDKSNLVLTLSNLPVPFEVGDILTMTLPASHLFAFATTPTCSLSNAASGHAAVTLPTSAADVRQQVSAGGTVLMFVFTVANADIAALGPRRSTAVFTCGEFTNPAPAAASVSSLRWATSTAAVKANEASVATAAISYPVPGLVRAAAMPVSTRAGSPAGLFVLILAPVPIALEAGSSVIVALPAPSTGWTVAANVSCVAGVDSPNPADAKYTGTTTLNDVTHAVSFKFAKALPVVTGTFRLFCFNVAVPANASAASSVGVVFASPLGLTVMSGSAPLPAITSATAAPEKEVLMATVTFAQTAPLVSYQIAAVTNAFNINAHLVAAGVRATFYSQTSGSAATANAAATQTTARLLLTSSIAWNFAEDLKVDISAAAADISAALNAATLSLGRATVNPTASPAAIAVQPATCFDGVRTTTPAAAAESDDDCGGASSCPRCSFDSSCTANSDCVTGVCQGATGKMRCVWVGATFPGASAAAATGAHAGLVATGAALVAGAVAAALTVALG